MEKTKTHTFIHTEIDVHIVKVRRPINNTLIQTLKGDTL